MQLVVRSADPSGRKSRIRHESGGLDRDHRHVVRGLLLEGTMHSKLLLGILIGVTACVTGDESDGVLSHDAFVQKFIGTTHDGTIYYDWDTKLASWDKVDQLYA